ncbi:hypothetical protein K9L16_01485 [Candidatus Pacearchaeota archaeon]|nr:hypothetical protein [Candidatus Pacearchaeota archaeon]
MTIIRNSKQELKQKKLEVEVKFDCGFKNIIPLKPGIKYYKCQGCSAYYEVETDIKIGDSR